MTREIAAYILLIAIFAGSLFNIHYMDMTIGELRDDAGEAYEALWLGDKEASMKLLAKASDRWLELDSYTHIFIKHTEIDSATDAFFDMLSDVSSGDADAALGSYRKLDAHLASLVSAEKLSFGSIF